MDEEMRQYETHSIPVNSVINEVYISVGMKVS